MSESRRRIGAALAEAGYPNAVIDDSRWWGADFNDPAVRVAAYRACFLDWQAGGQPLSLCWPCYRDWPSAWQPIEECNHDKEWA